MSESPSTKFIALVTIVAAPFALGAFLLAWAPTYGRDERLTNYGNT
jgi:hypothetical protein